MISRKDKLLNFPWQKKHYENHRKKVDMAKSSIDRTAPACYTHIIYKSKKIQMEYERNSIIQNENIRLLQKLGEIMRTKRLRDFWQEPRPNFLNKEKLFVTKESKKQSRSEGNSS